MKNTHSNLIQIKKKIFDEVSSKIQLKTNRFEILELGVGTGENFDFFPTNSNITISDKTDKFVSFLNESISKIKRKDINVSKLLILDANDMKSIESNSLDIVVHTFLLCSVKSIPKTLNEIYRILKLGGVCIFIEHSIDNRNSIRKLFQKALETINCKFLDMEKEIRIGCYNELVINKFYPKKFYMIHLNPIIYGY
ncbi:unnamed protein product, partial [Brachionus calyciflorus]